jgi:AcrR family transcriptional regulator
MNEPPKWRRRKDARPMEIAEAALAEFAEKGFANAKLDAIARRAGITKPALYRYFATKEALFHAVAVTAVAPNVAVVMATAAEFDGPFHQLLPRLLERMANVVQDSELPAVVRLVIGESRVFPDLARVWHDTVVEPMVSALEAIVQRAQLRGEVAAGDARLFAFSLVGPIGLGMLFREVFGGTGVGTIDLQALAAQHAQLALHGISPGGTHDP